VALKANLRKLPTVPAYYPGTEDRLQGLCAQYDQSKVEPIRGTPHPSIFKPDGTSTKPVLSVSLLDCDYGTPDATDAALKAECFCPALAVVKVSASNDTETFLSRAAEIANSECAGSLSCSVSIPSGALQKKKKIFDDFLANLKFGSVGVNCSTVFGYVSSSAGGGWGAYPGLYSQSDCGSGNGYIGNIGKRKGYAKTVVTSASVNSLADITSTPPALLSDILCACFLSTSTMQGLGRSVMLLLGAFFGLFPSLFSSFGSRKGYTRIE